MTGETERPLSDQSECGGTKGSTTAIAGSSGSDGISWSISSNDSSEGKKSLKTLSELPGKFSENDSRINNGL